MDIHKTDHGLYEARIGEFTYEFEKWGAEKALDGLADLGQLLAEPLAAAGGISGQAELGSEAVTRVVGLLMREISANRAMVMRLLKKLTADKVARDGKPIVFAQDEVFADNLAHLFQVAKAALEVQYGAFFAERGGLLDLLPMLRRSESGKTA